MKHGEMVVVFLGYANPAHGGGWTRVHYLCGELLKAGCSTCVVGAFSYTTARRFGSSIADGTRILNICPTFWTRSVLSVLSNLVASFVVLPIVFRILGPKVVVISLPSSESAIGAYAAARMTHSHVVIDYRDEWEDYAISQASSKAYRRIYAILKDVMSRIYGSSELVATVTAPLMQGLRSRGVGQVALVPNGADPALFNHPDRLSARRALNLEQGDFVMVYMGGVGGYYRLDVVVQALALIGPPLRDRIELLILGTGDELNHVMELAGRGGVRGLITHLGVAERPDDIARILAAADVGLVPYDANPLWNNAMPSKFFEYCGCGLATIAMVHDGSVLGQVVREENLGAVVPPLAANELARVIEEFASNPPLVSRYQQNAERLAKAEFNRKDITELYAKRICRLAWG